MQPYDANQPSQGRFAGATAPGKGRPGPSPLPPILNNAPTPAGLFRCLQRRLVAAVLVGLIFGGLAAGAAWLFAPEAKHTVRTTLRVPAGKGAFGVRVGDGDIDLVSHQRNQVALAKSRAVLDSALKSPKVAKLDLIQQMGPTTEALDWLENQVQVDFNTAPEIMKISMRGLETDELALIVEAVRDAYLNEVVDKERLRQTSARVNLEKMIQTYETKLKVARAEHKDLIAMAGPKNANLLAFEIAFKTQMLSSTQAELVRTKQALVAAKSRLTLFGQPDGGGAKDKGKEDWVDPLLLEARFKAHPEVSFLLARIEYLEAKLPAILKVARLGKKEPAYIQTERELQQLKGELATKSAGLKDKLRAELAEVRRLNSASAHDSLKQEIARLELLEKTLNQDIKEQREVLAKLKEDGAQAEIIREDNSVTEKMLKHLRTEKENLEIVLAVASPIRKLDDATVSRADDTRRRATLSAGAALGVFAFCLLGLAWLEYRTRKVGSVDDVVLGLGMRLVGTVPNSRRVKKAPSAEKAAEKGVGKGADSGSKKVPTLSQQVLTESIDAARTTLLHLARSHSLRTVMVTSATAGEGKTSLSCHLAASLARAGLRVLLIDADMRNPSAHKLFGVNWELGFSEVLSGKASPEDCIQETALRNLSLLPAGYWTDSTAAALNQGRAAVLFEQFRQQYDLIVVDSSPVLPVADSLLVAQQVDAVILSVLCNVSRLNNLYAAWQRVLEHGGQPLGVVINGVSGGTYGSYHYYPYPRRPKAKA